jgi:hypothetical protein
MPLGSDAVSGSPQGGPSPPGPYGGHIVVLGPPNHVEPMSGDSKRLMFLLSRGRRTGSSNTFTLIGRTGFVLLIDLRSVAKPFEARARLDVW